MSSPLFRKRTRGTPQQIGQAFPVGRAFGSKKLPAKIAIDNGKRLPTKSDIIEWSKKLDLVPKNMQYVLPTMAKAGSMSFDLGRNHLSAEVVLSEHQPNVGQFAVNENTVFLDSHLPIRDIPLTACHEICEKHFQDDLHIEWNPIGHRLATICEYNYAMQIEPEKGKDLEWDAYNKTVARISNDQKTGSKLGISLLAAHSALNTYSRIRGHNKLRKEYPMANSADWLYSQYKKTGKWRRLASPLRLL